MSSLEFSFSEFYLRTVGPVEGLPLAKLETYLAKRKLNPAASAPKHGMQILACDEVGSDVLAEIERMRASGAGPILVVSARCRNPAETPWEVLRCGADDFLVWQEAEDALAAIAARLLRWQKIEGSIDSLGEQGVVVGRSLTWRRALARIVEAARFGKGPVLIIGETGTGKELLARCVHALDCRPGKRDLVLVDGSAIQPELSGSELFGHEKGAFTGAVSAREGALARAHRGTLFLDEVGDIPSGLQGELLRAVQEGAYKPVGANHWKESQFRLVSATNRDLGKEVEKGTFRQDLYFRLAGFVCRIPPLRKRREDIPDLVEHFLESSCPSEPPALDRSVGDFLMQRDYPGNVRELKQVVGRLLCRYPGRGPLTVASIPEAERALAPARLAAREESRMESAVRAALARGKGMEEIRKSATQTAYSLVLNEEGGDTSRTAERLKVSKRAVQMFAKSNPS